MSRTPKLFFIPFVLAFFLPVSAQIPESILDDYTAGLKLLGEKQYRAFLSHNEKLIELAPNVCELYQKQAFAFYYGDLFSEGEQYFRKAIHKDSLDTCNYYGLGLLLHYNEKYGEAIVEFKQALRFSDSEPDVCIAAVNSWYAIQELDAAETFFMQKKIARPEDTGLLLALSYVAQLRSQWTNSERYLKKSLQLAPDNLRACFLLARLEIRRGEYTQALAYLEQARVLADNYINDPELPAKIQVRIATALSSLGQLEQAGSYFESAINAFEEFGNLHELASALNNYGTNLISLGRYQSGIRIFRKAQNAYRSIHYTKGIGYSYGNLGDAYARMGDFIKAREHFEQALAIARKTGDINFQRLALSDIAETLRALGNYSEALCYFSEAKEVNRELANRWVDADIFQKLGGIYADLGNYEKAIENYKKALATFGDIGDDQKVAFNLSLLSTLFYEIGIPDSANVLLQKSQMMTAKLNDPQIQLTNLLRLSQLNLRDRDAVSALKYADDAARLAQSLGSKYHRILTGIQKAKCMVQLGRFNNAACSYKKALASAQKMRQSELIWQAQYGLARIALAMTDTTNAVDYLQRTANTLSSLKRTTETMPFFTDFLRGKTDVYNQLIRLLANRGDVERAFRLADSLKSAPAHLDEISLAVNFRRGIPDSLRGNLLEVSANIERLYQQLSRPTKTEQPAEVAKVEKEIVGLSIERNRLLQTIAGLNSDLKMDINRLQEYLVPNQAVVEFVIGQESISVFLLFKDKLAYLTIPVTRDSLYDAMARVSPKFEMKARSQASGSDYLDAREMNFNIPALRKLRLFFDPIFKKLDAIKELIVVPDDILNYLPFEVLILSDQQSGHIYDFKKVEFLLHRFAISYATSVMNYFAESKLHEAPLPLLAVANPVSGDHGLSVNIELPFSEQEVKDVADILGSKNHIYVGTEATEEIVKQQASRFQVLHFATHSILDDWEPLYSKLLLSHQQRGAENGILQPFEILNLDLNCDMVVLSACNTGLGRLKNGEGLHSIARSFLIAGAHSLVASLWSVNDASTAAIQRSFYRYLKAGLKKNLALQRAKLDYIATVNSEKADPFLWAPFILLGSTDAIDFVEAENAWHHGYRWAVVLVLILTIGIIYSKAFRRNVS